MKILIIDDSRVSRLKLRQLFNKRNPEWQITEAGTGEEGIAAVTASAPDLVTLDINMPGIDGFVTAARLKELQPQIRIVLLSGNIQGSSQHRAETIGVGFVAKPVTDAAVDKVLAYLERPLV